MGGKKKLSLKQMERLQRRREEEERKRREKEKAIREKKSTGIFAPDIKDGETLEELKKMRVLTPYTVASRFNIRISVAKDFLEQLESNGLVQMVSGNHDIKIYKLTG